MYDQQVLAPTKRRTPLIVATVLVAVAAGVTAWLLISGVGSPSRPTAPVAAATPTLSLADQDVAFYRWVTRHPWAENGSTQEDWTSLAGSMCGAFDRGANYDDVATIFVQSMTGFSTGDAKDFIGEAVTVYCPEYGFKID